MGHVTIYAEDRAIEAAKCGAERAKVSVSQWFAKFAIEEEQKQVQVQNWDTFFVKINRLRNEGGDEFPSLEEIRAYEVPDIPRESW